MQSQFGAVPTGGSAYNHGLKLRSHLASCDVTGNSPDLQVHPRAT